MLRGFRGLPALVAVASLSAVMLVAAGPAEAAFKTGTPVYTQQANCLPEKITPAYTQQSSGVEPKVGEVFYISVRVDLLQTSWDCAADFFSVLATLPPGVQPATGPSDLPICQRSGANAQGNTVSDPRIRTNCPTAVAFDPATRQFRFGPKANPILPDVGGPAGTYWYMGTRTQDSQYFPTVQLHVPVKATQTMTNRPVSFLVCAVGTSCATAKVDLSVAAAAPAAAVEVSLPAPLETSAVGMRIPFAVNTGAGTQYKVKADTSTRSDFVGGRPCGATGPEVADNGGQPFTGRNTFDYHLGWPEPGDSCLLAPATTYYFKVCALTPLLLELGCRTGSFKTGAVSTLLRPPAESAADRPDSTQMTVRAKVVGGHPAGNLILQRRIKGTPTFTDLTLQSLGQSLADSSEFSASLSGLPPWRVFEMRSCFQSTAACSPSTEVVSGHVTASAFASAIGDTGATLAGFPSAPSPAGTLTFRAGTNPRAAAVDLPVVATRSLTQVLGTTASATSAAVTGLLPGTEYRWAVCFDVPTDAGVEDCSEIQTFSTTGVRDRTPPSAGIAVRGTPRRGGLVRVTVTASDPSGIARVAIQVGSAAAVNATTLRVRLPSRGSSVVISARATDRAGNSRLVTKRLALR